MRKGSVWVHKDRKAILKIISKKKAAWYEPNGEKGDDLILTDVVIGNIKKWWDKVPEELENEPVDVIRFYLEL